MISAFASYLGFTSSILVEAKAILFGLTFAKSLGLYNIWIESDSDMLVNCLSGLFDTPWSIEYLLRSISDLMKKHFACKVTHIHMEEDAITDCMANLGILQKASTHFSEMWLLPVEAKGVLKLEKCGFVAFRKRK